MDKNRVHNSSFSSTSEDLDDAVTVNIKPGPAQSRVNGVLKLSR